MSRTVLVLGAGLGGLVAAETLRKLLPDSAQVIAVVRNTLSRYGPALLTHNNF
jgi:NADH dehydrogenase FAD-containing subunit